MTDERDSLTGLIGADAAKVQIGAWRDRAMALSGQPTIHAMLLGLKRFAAVNLAYGEDAGDRALAEVAARLMHFAGGALEGEWLAARVGGRHFLLAVNEPCSRERWQWLAEELAETVSRPIADSGGSTVRLSPRIALLRALPREGAGRMLDRLAETLDHAQRQPGRRLQWVDGEMTLPGRPAQQLEADLLAALDRDEIEVLFQPQYGSTRSWGASVRLRCSPLPNGLITWRSFRAISPARRYRRRQHGPPICGCHLTSRRKTLPPAVSPMGWR